MSIEGPCGFCAVPSQSFAKFWRHGIIPRILTGGQFLSNGLQPPTTYKSNKERKMIEIERKHGTVKIDQETWNRIKKDGWSLTVKKPKPGIGYREVRLQKTYFDKKGNYVSQDCITLSRYILNLHDKNLTADHKDGDPLNNTKKNLRIATRSQNSTNSKRSPRREEKTSRYKGVTKRKNGIYVVRMGPAGIIYVGVFDNEIEAAKAYDKKAKELYGEFARLNFK